MAWCLHSLTHLPPHSLIQAPNSTKPGEWGAPRNRWVWCSGWCWLQGHVGTGKLQVRLVWICLGRSGRHHKTGDAEGGGGVYQMDMVEGHARQGEQHLQRLRDLEACDLFKEEHMVWNGWRVGCVRWGWRGWCLGSLLPVIPSVLSMGLLSMCELQCGLK